MTERPVEHQSAQVPEHLNRFFVERVHAGDVEGLVALYEPDAVLTFLPGQRTVGHDAIRRVLGEMVASGFHAEGVGVQPAVVCGDLALTSAVGGGFGPTAEVARRQPDGTWRWVIDDPRPAP
jgi:ketosteroid isomerase-like protein